MPKHWVLIVVGIAVMGSVGYSIAAGIIYLGPSIPGFEITGGNATDAGMTVDFGVNLSSAPPSPLSYEWFANGKVGYNNTFSSTFNSIGNYTVSLTLSMSSGHTKITKQFKERVNSDPLVRITENRSTIDVGQSISLTSMVNGGTAPYSYSWDFGSHKPDLVLKVNYNYWIPPPGFSGIQLEITDAAGYSVLSNSLYPGINSDPSINAYANTSKTTVGSPILFSACVSGGTSPYSYAWVLNGQTVSTLQDFVYSFSNAGTYVVEVIATDHVGESTSASITETIT